MYGKIIDLMNDENFYKVPKFLEIAEISPLALYLFSRMIDHYRYHVKHSDNKTHRDLLSLGWFWWTFPDIEKHVGLKKDQARTCLNELETVLLIEKETKRIGMEQRCWYRLNEDKIEFYLEKYRINKKEKRDGELLYNLALAVLPTTDSGETASNQALSNQALKESKELKPLTAKEPPSPTAINIFKEYYLKYRKIEYLPNYGKDGKLLKTLLTQITEIEYKSLLDKYFTSTDKFITGSDYGVGVFNSQVNKLRAVIDPSIDPFDLPPVFDHEKFTIDGKQYTEAMYKAIVKQEGIK
jgi:hypothetical protein